MSSQFRFIAAEREGIKKRRVDKENERAIGRLDDVEDEPARIMYNTAHETFGEEERRQQESC